MNSTMSAPEFTTIYRSLTPTELKELRDRIYDIMGRLPENVTPQDRLRLYHHASQMTAILYPETIRNSQEFWWIWLEQLDILATGLGGARIGTLAK